MNVIKLVNNQLVVKVEGAEVLLPLSIASTTALAERAEAALAEIQDIASGAPDAPSILNKADRSEIIPVIRDIIALTEDTVLGLVDFDGGQISLGEFDLTIEVPDSCRQVGIFNADGTGKVTLVRPYARPEWWGDIVGSIMLAHDALPATGGIIDLAARRYKPGGFAYAAAEADARYIKKPSVWLRGEAQPKLANDCRSLVGGSVIEGLVLAYADDFQATDMGADHGATVYGVYGAAAGGDPFINSYASTEQKTAETVRRGGLLRNVIGLNRAPDTVGHGIVVAEGIKGVRAESITGVYSINPVVNKAEATKGFGWVGMLGGSALAIIKADGQATAQTRDFQVADITLYRDGAPGLAPYVLPGPNPIGLNLNPDRGDVEGVRIGRLTVLGEVSNGVWAAIPDDLGGDILDVRIDVVETDGAVQALGLVNPEGSIVQLSVGQVIARNGTGGVNDNLRAGSRLRVGRVEATALTDVAFRGVGDGTTYADAEVGEVIATDCGAVDGSTGGAVRLNFDARPAIGRIERRGTTARTFAIDATFGSPAPALANGWTNVAGADPFEVTYRGGQVVMRGTIKPGTQAVFASLPPGLRPLQPKRFLMQGYDGATQVAVPVIVAVNGLCAVNDIAGGYANCDEWLSLSLAWDLD